MSFAFGSKSSKTNQQSQTDPWDVAIPDITNLLDRLRLSGTGLGSLTPDETSAITTLKTQAQAGNPWEADIANLTDKAFATPSQSGTVSDAYTRLEGQLGDYANGSFVDPSNDPILQRLLTQVGDEAQNRIASMYAGAGRDIAGNAIGTGAVARGVSQAQTPILVNQLNANRAQQIDAAKSLYGAGVTTGQTVQALDKDAFGTAMQGVGLSKEALAAKGYGPEQILQIEEMAKTLPVQELGLLAEMLFGAGQLGQQSTGTSKTNATGFSFGAKLI